MVKKTAVDSLLSEKKEQELKSYLNADFVKRQELSLQECVICGEKLANNILQSGKMTGNHENSSESGLSSNHIFLCIM